MDNWVDKLGEPFWSSRVLVAISIIRQAAIQSAPNAVAISFNGGKDSTVLWHLCKALGVDVLAVHFEEEDPFEELTSFTNSMLSDSSWPVRQLPKDYKEGMQTLVAQGVSTVLMGVRRTDPSQPKSYFEMSSEGWPVFMRVYPVLEWTYKDIWYFLKHLELPYCSLYDHGFTSLGAKSRTRPNPLLFGRPAWELADEATEREGRTKL
mmetsp:Transcript_26034/g.46178  ORF Transcript_26034/g.46178 Transcript_26034/m.46178 type:complete len:207 (+) Transcript_26034:3852-4472(+)